MHSLLQLLLIYLPATSAPAWACVNPLLSSGSDSVVTTDMPQTTMFVFTLMIA